jgi:hypothetical protein
MTPEALAARAAAIKAEWIQKAEAGDAAARRLLRECYPEEAERIEAAAAVLVRARRFAERDEP